MRTSASLKIDVARTNVADCISAEVRLYESQFVEDHPEAGGKDFIENPNHNSLKMLNAFVKPSLAEAKADDKFQFERHGYFVAERVNHAVGKLVFNLAVGLKDSFSR